MCVDENQKDTDKPIVFPEWSLLGTKLKRRDFRLDVMLKANDKPKNGQATLFDVPEEIRKYLLINPVTKEFMAEPICEYAKIAIVTTFINIALISILIVISLL